VCVYETETGRSARKTVAELVNSLLEAALYVVRAHGLVLVGSCVLEGEKAAGVDESLEAKRSILAHARDGEEERCSASGVDIATKSILTVSRAETGEAETADVSRATELETVVDSALRGSGLAAESQRVEKTAAQTGSERNTTVAFDARDGNGHGGLGFHLEFTKGDITLERAQTSNLGNGLEQITTRGHHGNVSGVCCPGVGQRRLEAVAGVCADAGRGLLCKPSDLSPKTVVRKVMLVARSGAPQEPRRTSPQHLLMRSPALECAACKATNLPSQIRVCQNRSVEVGAVCAPCPSTQAGVRIQALGSSKDISQHYVQVCASL
jgi:hypothetical protein